METFDQLVGQRLTSCLSRTITTVLRAVRAGRASARNALCVHSLPPPPTSTIGSVHALPFFICEKAAVAGAAAAAAASLEPLEVEAERWCSHFEACRTQLCVSAPSFLNRLYDFSQPSLGHSSYLHPAQHRHTHTRVHSAHAQVHVRLLRGYYVQ
jgi:hypothetical protein